MRRRPGISLLEVLIAIFVMAIGMLALLTLFPVGALSMAQAIKDNRAAQSAMAADAYARAMSLKTDANVSQYLTSNQIVYCDPFGVNFGLTSKIGGINRVAPSTVTSQALTIRQFSVLDDIVFDSNGTPQLSGGKLQRFNRITWAYLLRAPSLALTGVSVNSVPVPMSIVVYNNRPLVPPPNETNDTYSASGGSNYADPTGVTLSPANPPGTWPPAVRAGSWILGIGDTNTSFYRVVSVSNPVNNTLQIELQTPVQANNLSQVIVMEYVIEVFERKPL